MEMFTLAQLGKDDPMLLEHDFSTWVGSNFSERFFFGCMLGYKKRHSGKYEGQLIGPDRDHNILIMILVATGILEGFLHPKVNLTEFSWKWNP